MDIIRQIIEAAHHEQKTIYERQLKLTEETGELSEAILSMAKAPACGYKEKNFEDILEECCDVIICAVSIIELYESLLPPEELNKIFNKKITKWLEKLKEDPKKN